MFGEHFQLNEATLGIVEQIGKHMPGGFFIYKADAPEELLYANQTVLDIFGCRDLEDFKELGYPLLIGTSRKSVIGNTLDLPVTEREEGTIATTVLAVKAGVGMVRVHNVEANRRAIRMTRAILNA